MVFLLINTMGSHDMTPCTFPPSWNNIATRPRQLIYLEVFILTENVPYVLAHATVGIACFHRQTLGVWDLEHKFLVFSLKQPIAHRRMQTKARKASNSAWPASLHQKSHKAFKPKTIRLHPWVGLIRRAALQDLLFERRPRLELLLHVHLRWHLNTRIAEPIKFEILSGPRLHGRQLPSCVGV